MRPKSITLGQIARYMSGNNGRNHYQIALQHLLLNMEGETILWCGVAPFKILGVTSDNTSNNDKMIDHLSLLVNNFLDAANQIWCFNHILNLVTKSILCQFNVPKRDSRMSKDDENLLAGLAQELKNETDNKDKEYLTY